MPRFFGKKEATQQTQNKSQDPNERLAENLRRLNELAKTSTATSIVSNEVEQFQTELFNRSELGQAYLRLNQEISKIEAEILFKGLNKNENDNSLVKMLKDKYIDSTGKRISREVLLPFILEKEGKLILNQNEEAYLKNIRRQMSEKQMLEICYVSIINQVNGGLYPNVNANNFEQFFRDKFSVIYSLLIEATLKQKKAI